MFLTEEFSERMAKIVNLQCPMSSNVSREKPVEGILPQACVPIEKAFFATSLARICIELQACVPMWRDRIA